MFAVGVVGGVEGGSFLPSNEGGKSLWRFSALTGAGIAVAAQASLPRIEVVRGILGCSHEKGRNFS